MLFMVKFSYIYLFKLTGSRNGGLYLNLTEGFVKTVLTAIYNNLYKSLKKK